MHVLNFFQWICDMAIVKVLHVLCIFIWTGNLLSLSRMMGYHVKQNEETQKNLALLYRRMYNFVGLPTMVLAIVFGGILVTTVDQDQGLLWFFEKMGFAIGLVVCDVICGQYIAGLNLGPDTSRGIQYKILHGIVGLLLIGVFVSIYLVRP